MIETSEDYYNYISHNIDCSPYVDEMDEEDIISCLVHIACDLDCSIDELPDNVLAHYGTPRHSGRYPWGSGKNPQRNKNLYTVAEKLKKQGLTDTQIAKALNMSTTDYRARYSIAKDEKRKYDIERSWKLREHGYSKTKIAEILGTTEGTIRNYLKDGSTESNNKTINTAKQLKEQLKKHKYLDIGPGTEISLGVSRTRLDTAVAMLKDEGYHTYNIYVHQLGTHNQDTTVKVLAPKDAVYKDVRSNLSDIGIIDSHSFDGGKTFFGMEYPKSIDSKRVMIRYNEDGGIKKDGVIELRRGVEDISLGNSQYAQVRIAVDDSHYIKGMAMYTADDSVFPKGVDIIFNTNKHVGTPMLGDKNNSVLKLLKKDDPTNPFGAAIDAKGQRHYNDENGVQQLSVINKVTDEGEWNDWSKNLASQFLSKQSVSLARTQLNQSYAERKLELETIMNLTNPVVKKILLKSYANACDAASVHLKAAALPRQRFQVILPIPSLKETEVFAPNFKDGEEVVLVRYPHGGIFEIPKLRVNNKSSDGRAVMGNAIDAIGINPKVAEQLSGADFDGDTVLVIPNKNVNIRTRSPLEGLKGFDPKEEYKLPDSTPRMKAQTKQKEMGVVSNLITDMTLQGAGDDEIVRAVKQSMVVIDAEKHHLDYKKSEKDNNIDELKRIYQAKPDGTYGGASTLISKASSEIRLDKRKQSTGIDPETGEKIYKPVDNKDLYYMKRERVKVKDPQTGKYLKDTNGEYVYEKDPSTGKDLYVDTGKVLKRETISTKMAEAKDAYDLVLGGSKETGTPMENVYANYANQMKALANQARKEMISTPRLEYSKEANDKYASEVSSLMVKLNDALKNSPRERQAQIIANEKLSIAKQDNPNMSKDDEKKKKGIFLNSARAAIGASKPYIEIEDREWEAIQAGAISHTKVEAILNNTKMEQVKERAMPRKQRGLTPAQKSLMETMKASEFYSNADIAERLGVSVSTVTKELAKEN